ncbi:MAG: metallophosphoesterase [Cyanothece sp. SIO1E1]|nr:metallophosphoesterase [Cyanothece sp. SIO1E1]
MVTREDIVLVTAAVILSLSTIVLMVSNLNPNARKQTDSAPQLLSDPFLQLPTSASVRVVWFTEFPGTSHTVRYGQPGQGNNSGPLSQKVQAKTTQLSRIREDRDSKVRPQSADEPAYKQPRLRPIWRHEAEVIGLVPGERVPYQVISTRTDGKTVSSRIFSLAAAPPAGQPLKILLTSDHQLMPMTPTNLQKVEATIGQVDAVFLAGDLVNIPDRASEWFDDQRGNAFFPSLQGRANYVLKQGSTRTTYQGGEIIQHAPLFPAIGNHEVMGRFSMTDSLKSQFGDPVPKAIAGDRYETVASLLNPKNDSAVRQTWLKNQSFNTDTYEEIFSLPQGNDLEGYQGTGRYYAATVGDVRLVVLYVTSIWRRPSLEANVRGRYRERDQDLMTPEGWGYGQHIFEPIAQGSPQYTWLAQELASPEFQQAKYKLVMFHHPPHTLGDNIVPAFTNPVQMIDRHADGSIQAIRYEYPQQADYIIRDLVPLLEQARVQLVYFGHSHLWNRFMSPSGMHFLESSNVGNTYGAFVEEKQRPVPENYTEKYVATGDPNGLAPVVPTIAPLNDEKGQPLPYLANNDITAFSILDTGQGTVSSYRFDTRKPRSAVIKFDEFTLR